MKVHFLEEKNQKKFAILPYADFVKLVECTADEEDYQKAMVILANKKDKIVPYNPDQVLESPIALKRKALALSQRELAKKMKVDPAYISRLEKLGANPSKATLLKLARALGCPVEELM